MKKILRHSRIFERPYDFEVPFAARELAAIVYDSIEREGRFDLPLAFDISPKILKALPLDLVVRRTSILKRDYQPAYGRWVHCLRTYGETGITTVLEEVVKTLKVDGEICVTEEGVPAFAADYPFYIGMVFKGEVVANYALDCWSTIDRIGRRLTGRLTKQLDAEAYLPVKSAEFLGIIVGNAEASDDWWQTKVGTCAVPKFVKKLIGHGFNVMLSPDRAPSDLDALERVVTLFGHPFVDGVKKPGRLVAKDHSWPSYARPRENVLEQTSYQHTQSAPGVGLECDDCYDPMDDDEGPTFKNPTIENEPYDVISCDRICIRDVDSSIYTIGLNTHHEGYLTYSFFEFVDNFNLLKERALFVDFDEMNKIQNTLSIVDYESKVILDRNGSAPFMERGDESEEARMYLPFLGYYTYNSSPRTVYLELGEQSKVTIGSPFVEKVVIKMTGSTALLETNRFNKNLVVEVSSDTEATLRLNVDTESDIRVVYSKTGNITLCRNGSTPVRIVTNVNHDNVEVVDCNKVFFTSGGSLDDVVDIARTVKDSGFAVPYTVDDGNVIWATPKEIGEKFPIKITGMSMVMDSDDKGVIK